MRRHSPHGECGLKLSDVVSVVAIAGSLPAWGVRVEIPHLLMYELYCCVTPRMGSAG